MKYIQFLAALTIAAVFMPAFADARSSREAQIATIVKRFITLADQDLGWKHFSKKMIAALKPDERYSEFVSELTFYSDICKSGLGSSVSKRALMLCDHRDELPFDARTLLNSFSIEDLIVLVHAHAKIDSQNTGCQLTY